VGQDWSHLGKAPGTNSLQGRLITSQEAGDVSLVRRNSNKSATFKIENRPQSFRATNFRDILVSVFKPMLTILIVQELDDMHAKASSRCLLEKAIVWI
jgi:hypothetical protein